MAAGCGSLGALLTAVPICRESDLFLLDAQQLRAGTEGWLVFDITAASSHWLVERKYNLGLRLYVETDNGKNRCSIGARTPETPSALQRAVPICGVGRAAGCGSTV